MTFVQRFGGALNLNVHFHTLVLDGVFDPAKEMRFRRLPEVSFVFWNDGDSGRVRTRTRPTR